MNNTKENNLIFNEEENQKQRLFVDMDGTLARFHDEVDYIEKMWTKGFYSDLKPFESAVEGLKLFMAEHPEVEVFILSATLDGEPPYCRVEKNEWLDRYLPQIDNEHRIFTEAGKPKPDYVPDGIRQTDHLFDDYNKNLNEWSDYGGQAVKAKNNINHKGLGAYGGEVGKLWQGNIVDIMKSPQSVSNGLAQVITTANGIKAEVNTDTTAETKTLVVNIYGGPGAGKSTTALNLVAELKKQGFHADYVSEVAKDLVYAKDFKKLDGSLENQQKIFSEQKARLDLLIGNVDVAVTDSPLLLNTVYLKENAPGYVESVFDQYSQYNNYNIVVERDLSSEFEKEGRIHNLEESIEKDGEIRAMLDLNNVKYTRYDRNNLTSISQDITKKINELAHSNITILTELQSQINTEGERNQMENEELRQELHQMSNENLTASVEDTGVSMYAEQIQELAQSNITLPEFIERTGLSPMATYDSGVDRLYYSYSERKVWLDGSTSLEWRYDSDTFGANTTSTSQVFLKKLGYEPINISRGETTPDVIRDYLYQPQDVSRLEDEIRNMKAADLSIIYDNFEDIVPMGTVQQEFIRKIRLEAIAEYQEIMNWNDISPYGGEDIEYLPSYSHEYALQKIANGCESVGLTEDKALKMYVEVCSEKEQAQLKSLCHKKVVSDFLEDNQITDEYVDKLYNDITWADTVIKDEIPGFECCVEARASLLAEYSQIAQHINGSSEIYSSGGTLLRLNIYSSYYNLQESPVTFEQCEKLSGILHITLPKPDNFKKAALSNEYKKFKFSVRFNNSIKAQRLLALGIGSEIFKIHNSQTANKVSMAIAEEEMSVYKNQKSNYQEQLQMAQKRFCVLPKARKQKDLDIEKIKTQISLCEDSISAKADIIELEKSKAKALYEAANAIKKELPPDLMNDYKDAQDFVVVQYENSQAEIPTISKIHDIVDKLENQSDPFYVFSDGYEDIEKVLDYPDSLIDERTKAQACLMEYNAQEYVSGENVVEKIENMNRMEDKIVQNKGLDYGYCEIPNGIQQELKDFKYKLQIKQCQDKDTGRQKFIAKLRKYQIPELSKTIDQLQKTQNEMLSRQSLEYNMNSAAAAQALA